MAQSQIVKVTLNNMLQAGHTYRMVAKDGTGIYIGSVIANTNALSISVNSDASSNTQYVLQFRDEDGNIVNSSLAAPATGGIVIIDNIAIIEDGLQATPIKATMSKTTTSVQK